MTFTRKTIAAYLSGALDPDEAASLEAQAQADPRLAQRIEKMRRLLAEEDRGPGRPPKNRTERLHVRVSTPVREWVRTAAHVAGQSEADVIEALVRDRMEQGGSPAPAGQEPDPT